MTVAIAAAEQIDFPCKPWRVQGESLQDFHVNPILGSWTTAPEFLMRKGKAS